MRFSMFAAALWLASGMALAADEKPLTADEQLALIASVRPSAARVEYTLQFDRGEAPTSAGLTQRCPHCGGSHVMAGEEVVKEERSLEAEAWVLSPTRVVCRDLLCHPRFIKAVHVRLGGQVVAAKRAAYGQDRPVAFLDLAEPLREAKPLAFDPTAEGPYLVVNHQEANAAWTFTVKPFAPSVSLAEDGRRFLTSPATGAIVNRKGTPLTVCVDEELPADASWKATPGQWAVVTAEAREQLLARMRGWCAKGLFRVELGFRSPKGSDAAVAPMPWRFRGGDQENPPTEMHAVGLLLDERRALVLATLQPKVTARLERIRLHPAEGKPVEARFQASLRDYGAFVAMVDQPMAGAIPLAQAGPREFHNRLLPSLEARIQGASLVAYEDHERLNAFELGWKRQVTPRARGMEANVFVFSPEGGLVAMPIAQRPKVSTQERWHVEQPAFCGATYLRDVLADVKAHADASNTPLTEAEENRLAWMGVVLQHLNPDLARANQVSHLTRDGTTGALVSHVYPGSPAAKNDVRAGDVLLRLHVEGEPKPLEVEPQHEGMADYSFLMERMEQTEEVPDMFLDRLPPPWAQAENAFTRQLTDLGFGRRYTAEFFRGGQVMRKEFTVEASPPHFDSAGRFKSDPLGLTVRDLTYEVRHHFQRKAEDPGVILSKIEKGGKAAVARLRPYEIITHVNGQPVAGVADFEKAVAGEGELRLTVQRMTQTRVVKIQRTAGEAPKPAAK